VYARTLYLLVEARHREIQEVGGKQHFLLPKTDSYYILTLQLFATLTSSLPSIDFYINKGTASRERASTFIHSPRPLSFFFIAFCLLHLPEVPSRDLNSGLQYSMVQRTTN
jgi:hypothetical protein